MHASELDALIIPSADPHMSEYLPEHWKIMAWLTGFTGSAGTVVITQDFAGVWTDSRYFIQAEEQLSGSGFSLVKLVIPHTPEYIAWLAATLPEKSRIGYDGKTVSLSLSRKIDETAKYSHFIINENADLISGLWKDRPPLPRTPVFLHDKKFTGISAAEKMEKIRHRMSQQKSDILIISALDEIAWLFNIRASDIAYNPVVIAHAMIFHEEARLFVNPGQTDAETESHLNAEGIDIYPYEEWWDHLSSLPEGIRVWCPPLTTNILTYNILKQRYTVFEAPSPVAVDKAVKNPVEISNIRETMIHDGIALERFFFWLEHHIGKERISEISAAEKLESFRKKHPHYRGPGFSTISSFGKHGAIVHYIPSPESDIELKPEGIYLLDSGGQYLSGTTDVTRTVATGTPDGQQKDDFTRVLKGMISLAMLRFPEGTKGFQMDILARRALWQTGLNYGHGTGHGVGYFLNVHEGPQSIGTGASESQNAAITPGMIVSDEPGIYRENEYGIRTENLILCVPDTETAFGRFYAFETLTLCHIDRNLIKPELLSDEEKEWINRYHHRVYELLSPGLSPEEKTWLKNKTKPLIF